MVQSFSCAFDDNLVSTHNHLKILYSQCVIFMPHQCRRKSFTMLIGRILQGGKTLESMSLKNMNNRVLDNRVVLDNLLMLKLVYYLKL